MSMLDGVSQCWPLAKDCAVWWEAHSATAAWTSVIVAIVALVVASLSVLVTAASAWAVWRLGTEANSLARVPAALSETEREREAIVILSVLYAEFASISSVAGAWKELATEFGVDRLLDENESRSAAAESLRQMEMPMTKSLLGRLHVLPAQQSAKVAHCLGLVLNLNAASEALEASGRGAYLAAETIERMINEAAVLEEKADQLIEEAGRVLYSGAGRPL